MSATLKGLRLLNTRPLPQGQSLTEDIIAKGGTVIACPTIAIKPIPANLSLLTKIDKAIFISPNAVTYCFKQLEQEHLQWPKAIEVIAIGKSTAKCLTNHGITDVNLPIEPDSEHLLLLKELESVTGQRILLIKGKEGRGLIETRLIQKGAEVLSMEVYERVLPQLPKHFIASIWRNDLVDIILITSEQSLNHLLKLFGEEAKRWLESKTYCLISTRLAKAASLLGLKKQILSHPHHILETLLDYHKGLTYGQ